MSTWEERMAARASRGPLILDRDTARQVADELAARLAVESTREAERDRQLAQANDARTWTGTCDVCGQPILLRHSNSVDGIIDIGINENGIPYTWIWHDGPLPDCRIYSSPVYQVPE